MQWSIKTNNQHNSVNFVLQRKLEKVNFGIFFSRHWELHILDVTKLTDRKIDEIPTIKSTSVHHNTFSELTCTCLFWILLLFLTWTAMWYVCLCQTSPATCKKINANIATKFDLFQDIFVQTCDLKCLIIKINSFNFIKF